MTSPIDLHALANAPGYGKAQDAVRAAGHWDEDPGTPEWIVEVEATATITTTVTVRAGNADEAKRLAYEAADADGDWAIDICSVDISETSIVLGPT